MKKAHSKYLALFLVGTLSVAALAYASVTENYDVVVRKKNGGFKIEPRPLVGLLAENTFETNHFRIVWKKDEIPLTDKRISEIIEMKATNEKENPLWVDRDSDRIRLMAANSLYHAEIAHHYFTDLINSPEVKKLEKIIIRLDLTHNNVKGAHYTHDNYDPQFNNALSINGGTPRYPGPENPSWGREIWFRPVKKIPISEILSKLPEDPANPQIRQARAELYPMQIDLGIRTTLYAAFQSRLDSPGYIDSMTRQGGTFLLMEGAFQVLKLVNRVLIPQYLYIDPSLVPEIIYHEFSHIALTDFLEPNVSTPVNEGMADFFAADMANSPEIAKKIKKFSTSVSKNGKKRQFFQIEFEGLGKAQSDFVLSILWGLRDVVGERPAARLVFGARKFLSTKDSDIRSGLITAIFKSCETNCESPLRDRLALHHYFQSRGL